MTQPLISKWEVTVVHNDMWIFGVFNFNRNWSFFKSLTYKLKWLLRATNKKNSSWTFFMKHFFGKSASNYHLTHRKMHNIQMYIKFSVLCWFLSFSLRVNLYHKCPVTRANDPQFGHNGFVIQIIIQQIIHLITPERVANSNTYSSQGGKVTESVHGVKRGSR